jgi:NAD(P)-dependent dehydrogenase (short-subunit alcohol dehydrogenase family)
LGSISEEHFDKLFNINVKGALFTVQQALPLLNDGGSIILTGSVGSVKGTPSVSSSKSMVILSGFRYACACRESAPLSHWKKDSASC